jgi:hypothetical protein
VHRGGPLPRPTVTSFSTSARVRCFAALRWAAATALFSERPAMAYSLTFAHEFAVDCRIIRCSLNGSVVGAERRCSIASSTNLRREISEVFTPCSFSRRVTLGRVAVLKIEIG